MEIKVEVELVKVSEPNQIIAEMSLIAFDRCENGEWKVYGIRNVGNRRGTIMEQGGIFISDEEFSKMKDPYDFY